MIVTDVERGRWGGDSTHQPILKKYSLQQKWRLSRYLFLFVDLYIRIHGENKSSTNKLKYMIS